jgi:hypothetical protein
LVTNVNVDSNGLYTAALGPASFASHMGVFAVLQAGERRFPAVIEIYRNGLRAVPLSVFLSPSFCSYVEVYRLDEIGPAHQLRINVLAVKLLNEVKGYSFLAAGEEEPGYLYCTGVFNKMLESLGIEPIETKSYCYNDKMNENLTSLGYSCHSVLTPVDIAVDSRVQFIGVLDNGRFDLEISRFAAIHDLAKHMSEFDLNVDKLPFMYYVYDWAIAQVEAGTYLGRVLLLANGFTTENFPRGPRRFCSFVKSLDFYLKRIVKKISLPLQEIIEKQEGVFSVHDLLDSDPQTALLNKYNGRMRKFFHIESQDS